MSTILIIIVVVINSIFDMIILSSTAIYSDVVNSNSVLYTTRSSDLHGLPHIHGLGLKCTQIRVIEEKSENMIQNFAV